MADLAYDAAASALRIMNPLALMALCDQWSNETINDDRGLLSFLQELSEGSGKRSESSVEANSQDTSILRQQADYFFKLLLFNSEGLLNENVLSRFHRLANDTSMEVMASKHKHSSDVTAF
jgi:hypothetical protein